MHALTLGLLVYRLFLLLLGSCYLNSFPLSPVKVEPSIYKVLSNEAQGTAWVVAPHYLITAGHMCTHGDSFSVVRGNGWTYPVEPVLWSMSLDASGDVCIMHSDLTLDRPLILAKGPPAVGAKDHYVGYPHGTLGRFDGTYMADGGSSAWCGPGASGSPVFTEVGVYGVLVQGRPGGDEDGYGGHAGCQSTPVSYLLPLLNEVGVSYTLTPEMPAPLPDTE
jgi:hypothetical protein